MRSLTIPRRSRRAPDLNQRLADSVGEYLAGQQAAAQLIEQVQADVGHGDELADAIRDLDGRSDAYANGFARTVQKFQAAGAHQ